MSQPELACTHTDGSLEFKTNTGLALLRGTCHLKDDRGNTWPGSTATQQHAIAVDSLSSQAATFRQTLHNAGSEPIAITGIRMFDGELALQGAGWRVAHPELFRCDRYFEGYTHYTEGLLAPVADIARTRRLLGMSEDLPFPGILFTHPERGAVLMAALTQDRCKPVWRLQQDNSQTRIIAEERFTGVEHLRLDPGQTLNTETWIVLCTPGGIEEALQQYHALLRERHHFYGENSILHNAVVWGSWNYNYRERGHGDIDHDWIAANARGFAKIAPDTPRFVMIDDGYQRHKSHETSGWYASCMEIFYEDGQPPHDPSLFPNGMKAIADDIRATGAHPALWITPRLHRDSALAREHPEWLLGFDEDDRVFGTRSAFLDYSLPEVRDYVRSAWRTIFQEWGFEAVKMDFWTMAFELPNLKFRDQDRTAIELRHQYLSDLREFVPDNGYIIACCAVNNGNPFIGQYADATRCAPDVGDGDWDHLRESAKCLTAVMPFLDHACLLSDPDSFGWCPQAKPGENRLWATLALMAGGMCEIAGDLDQPTDEARDLLDRAARFFAASPARRTITHIDAPGIAQAPSPHVVLHRDDGIYEAHFNWGVYPREVYLPSAVRDLWTDQPAEGRHKIPPHDVLWFKRER